MPREDARARGFAHAGDRVGRRVEASPHGLDQRIHVAGRDQPAVLAWATSSGMPAGCPEEVAYTKKFITAAQLRAQADKYAKTAYGQYLSQLADEQ